VPILIKKKAVRVEEVVPVVPGGLTSSEPVPQIVKPYEPAVPIICRYCKHGYLKPSDKNTDLQDCWNWLTIQARQNGTPLPGTRAYAEWRTKVGEHGKS